MSLTFDGLGSRLSPEQLARRWQAFTANPECEDLAMKIELSVWGERLMRLAGMRQVRSKL